MLITIVREVNVLCGLEETFRFLANPVNDRLWRKEINQTELKGPLITGAVAFEYSRLSYRQPNHLLILVCVDYVPNRTVTFQSRSDQRFHLQSVRSVQYVSANETAVRYELTFDTNLVKFALGFALPRSVIALKAKRDMKRYLGNLQSVLTLHCCSMQ